jgi:ABC-type nitrate/sulfonate/bicarbonate transport system substrate-binding protein
MTPLKSLSLAAALSASVGLALPALAAQEETSVALPALTITFTPVYVAKDAGIWEKEGLDVKLHDITGMGSTNAMLSGSVDFGVQSGPSLIRGNIRGQKMVGVALMASGVAFEITMRKESLGGVTASSPFKARMAALKGKKVAVDSPNTVVEGFLRYVAAKGGLDPVREYTVTYMQPPAMLAALKTGAIDAGVFTFPWTKTSQRQGDVLVASGLSDVSELLPTTATTTTTRPDFCDKKPSVCTKLVRGYVLAHGFIHDRPNDAIEILKKRMPKADVSDLTSSFAEMRKNTPRIPSYTESSFVNAQKLMIVGGMIKEEEKVNDFSAMYTNKFVK